MIRVLALPSAFMIQICGVPLRSDVNAIWLPVGDHVGVTSIVGCWSAGAARCRPG